MYKQETDLINDKNVREDLVGRVEVLDKVKGLLLLPSLEMATTRQVSEFYKVKQTTIRSLIYDNEDELVSDGMMRKKYKEISSLLEGTNSLKEMQSFGVGGRGAVLFPKRAILRVGMLLRDSEVAKEVRTQLLNIEEATPNQVKEFSIDNEKEIVERIVNARLSNDWTAYDKANFEYTEYQNRYIEQQNGIIESQKPKVKEFDNLLFSDVSINSSEIASRYVNMFGSSLSARDINTILEEEGLIKSKGNNKYLTSKGWKIGGVPKSFAKGYHLVEYVQWTIRSGEKLHNIFKKYGLKYK